VSAPFVIRRARTRSSRRGWNSVITDFPDVKTDLPDLPQRVRRRAPRARTMLLVTGTPIAVRREELTGVVPKERSSGLVGRWVASAHGADPWNLFWIREIRDEAVPAAAQWCPRPRPTSRSDL